MVRGGNGDDNLNGGGGAPGRRADLLFGNAGNDTVNGGPGWDFIAGNLGNDTLNGGGGKDRIFGGKGDDTVNGGPGAPFSRRRFEDRLHGGDGNDKVNGGNGRDYISGGAGDDISTGGAGADRIFANLGADQSFGGNGNDDLWALARGDVAAPGDPSGDALTGGDGDDTFHTRDGEVDRIDCGNGTDTALLDQFDLIVDATPANPNGSCERVVRSRCWSRTPRRTRRPTRPRTRRKTARSEAGRFERRPLSRRGPDSSGPRRRSGARQVISFAPCWTSAASAPRSWPPTSPAWATRWPRSWTPARGSSTWT